MTAARSLIGGLPPVLHRPLRFLGVGVLNTGFGYGVFAIAVWQGVGPQLALILQFALGIIWNYMTHAQLVFAVRGIARLPYYALAYGVIYGVNAAGLAALMHLGLSPYVAQATALPFIVVMSFVLVSKALGVPVGVRREAAQ